MTAPTPVTRIDTLTDEQRATFPGWVEQWVAVGHRTGPLTRDEWVTVEAAARACYRLSGLAEPRVVLGVASPLAAAVACSVAKHVAADGVRDGVWDGVAAGVWAGVGAGVADGVRAGVGAGVAAGVWAGVEDGVRAGVAAGVWAGVWAGVAAGVWAGVEDGVRAGVAAGVWAGVWAGVEAGVRAGVWAGVEDGVEDAPDWLRSAITRGLAATPDQWYRQRQGGNLWCSWEAWASWFPDVGGLQLPGDLPEKLQARRDLTLAGQSHWYAGFTIISDRPTLLHIETAGGQTRMHCADGPAIAWSDGFALHFWHGTLVPADLIETGWDTARILAEPNAEIRRCAIERMGWDQFIDAAGLAQVGQSAPDPGNPGNTLALYDVPESIYDEPVRVLLATNATPERDGARRRFGLTCPADISDPIAAAAWTFDVPVDQYRALERAT